MQEIVQAVQQVSERIGGISTAAEEQSVAAAASLSGQAKELSALVQTFRLDDTDDMPPAGFRVDLRPADDAAEHASVLARREIERAKVAAEKEAKKRPASSGRKVQTPAASPEEWESL